MTSAPRRTGRRIVISALTMVAAAMVGAAVVAVPAQAQKPKTGAAGAPKTAAKASDAKSAVGKSLAGTWSGTATVQLGDSAIVVPVMYVFTDAGGTIGGTATVPGQGMGPITNVVRSGDSLRFRVTVTQGLLEHQGTVGADGVMQGMVNMNNLPVARFKVSPKK